MLAQLCVNNVEFQADYMSTEDDEQTLHLAYNWCMRYCKFWYIPFGEKQCSWYQKASSWVLARINMSVWSCLNVIKSNFVAEMDNAWNMASSFNSRVQFITLKNRKWLFWDVWRIKLYKLKISNIVETLKILGEHVVHSTRDYFATGRFCVKGLQPELTIEQKLHLN